MVTAALILKTEPSGTRDGTVFQGDGREIAEKAPMGPTRGKCVSPRIPSPERAGIFMVYRAVAVAACFLIMARTCPVKETVVGPGENRSM